MKAPIVDGDPSRPGLWGGIRGYFRALLSGTEPLHRVIISDMLIGGTLINVVAMAAAFALFGIEAPTWLATAVFFSPVSRTTCSWCSWCGRRARCREVPGPGRRGSCPWSGSGRCSSSEPTPLLPSAAARSYSRASRRQRASSGVLHASCSSSGSRDRRPCGGARRVDRHRQYHRRHGRPGFAPRYRPVARSVQGRDRPDPHGVGLCRLLPAFAVARFGGAVHQQPPDPHRRPHLLRGFRRAADQLLLQDPDHPAGEGRPARRRGEVRGEPAQGRIELRLRRRAACRADRGRRAVSGRHRRSRSRAATR